MSSALSLPIGESLIAAPPGLWDRMENAVLASLLAAMCAVPVIEMLLRTVSGTGIYAAAAITQHLGLMIGMLGSAIAARERRLLTMSAMALVLPVRARALAGALSNSLAVAVCAVLTVAETSFVLSERNSGSILAYGVPTWWIELLMPAAFAMVGWRLLARVATTPATRVPALIACVAIGAAAARQPALSTPVFAGLSALLVLGAIAGTPLLAVLAGAAALLFWQGGLPLAAVAIDHYRTVVNPSLPAIPLFTLAGYLMAESSAPRRLVEVFDSLFGRVRGGGAMAAVLACTFFTSFTGASGATVLALGGLVMPLLRSRGYGERSALGLVTAAGLPGTLVMPALPLILYAIVAGVTMKDMFLAGVLPSLLMILIVTLWGVRQEPSAARSPKRLDIGRVRRALRAAAWELGVPLVPVLSFATGIATPVESAALTAVYALVVCTVIRGDLRSLGAVRGVLTECGLVVGGILLIMGMALGLTDFLVDAQVPDRIVVAVTTTVANPYLFLLVLNVVLLAAGCLIEIYPAILVLAPIVTQLGKAFAIDPRHLGVIFLSNLELGYLTPLVGLNLFFASYRFNKPIAEIFRAVLPVFVALAAGVLVITYLPALSTALPRLFHE